MGSTLNMIAGGGGLYPTLEVTIINGTATGVTATLGSTVVNLAYDSAAGVWRGTLKAIGTWTVEASNGEKTVSDTVDVTSVAVYNMALYFSHVPSGYTELEYVEGSSPITIPNFQSTSDIGWEVDFSTTYSTTSAWYRMIYGNNSENTRSVSTAVFPDTQRGFGVRRGSTSVTPAMSGTYYSGRHVVSVSSSGNCYLDGVSFATNYGSPPAESFNLTIFQSITAKLYSLIFNHGSTEYLHFFPAIRDSDQKVGLYETVTSTFSYPASGNLSAGPSV